MSKLYDTYISLKANEEDTNNTLYLFKAGLFFICIDKDAQIASNILNLKLTNLNETIVKCGFPIQSLEKYSNLLKLSNYQFKIVDTTKKEAFSIFNYSTNTNIDSLLSEIKNINPETLSIKEAYSFIEEIKEKVSVIEGGLNNGKD